MSLVALTIVTYVLFALLAAFVPVGNENSTVRRLPIVTFTMIALNVVIYFVTLPSVGTEKVEIEKTLTKVHAFVLQHEELLADAGVGKKLVETGLISKTETDQIDEQMKSNSDL